jgi:membrane-bound lytic murein transglycosylase B
MAGIKNLPVIIAFTACVGTPVIASAKTVLASFTADFPPYNTTATAPNSSMPGNSAFSSWLQNFRQEAVANGISSSAALSALDRIEPDERVIDLDQKQPENTVTFAAYIDRVISDKRIEEGRELMRAHASLLRDVGQSYGVAPSIIVALWGVESNFGRNPGDFDTLDSLATLAYEGRRADLFRNELMAALNIIDKKHVPASSLRGSWAGAMGQCQFMPSTYLHYAVSYKNEGAPDIWDDEADVFASIANYIVAEGWKADQTWGLPVEVTQASLPTGEIGLDHKHSVAEWSGWGVKPMLGQFTQPQAQASLIQPDGPDGRSFLVYDNFRALMRWNRSSYFAASVGLLADLIR